MNYYNSYGYQPVRPSYLPLVYVQGIEGARSYIVEPNSTVFLMDSDGKFLIKKSADQFGKPYIEEFQLNAASTKTEYATTAQLEALQRVFEEKLNKLSELIERGGKNE